MSIAGYSYKPARITVMVGTTVSFNNHDTTNHTVTADDKSFDLGNLDQGHAGRFRFNHSGTFPYHCSYHPFMHGTVVVK